MNGIEFPAKERYLGFVIVDEGDHFSAYYETQRIYIIGTKRRWLRWDGQLTVIPKDRVLFSLQDIKTLIEIVTFEDFKV